MFLTCASLQIFDPALVKKKKKKKTTFDLDAALADGDSAEVSAPTATVSQEAENHENSAADGIDLDNDLDLETFGKKKRKKKKTGFNLDDLDAALPAASTDDANQDEDSGAAFEDEGVIDDTFDLTTRKKNRKKIKINELLKDNKENEELENGKLDKEVNVSLVYKNIKFPLTCFSDNDGGECDKGRHPH